MFCLKYGPKRLTCHILPKAVKCGTVLAIQMKILSSVGTGVIGVHFNELTIALYPALRATMCPLLAKKLAQTAVGEDCSP
jgi:hypothetical protein